MGRKYAVAFINFFDNGLQLKVVEAASQKDALEAAFPGYAENVAWDNGVENARDQAVDQDWDFCITEL